MHGNIPLKSQFDGNFDTKPTVKDYSKSDK